MTETYEPPDEHRDEDSSEETSREWAPLQAHLDATPTSLQWPAWGRPERWWVLPSEATQPMQALSSAETDIFAPLATWGPFVAGFVTISDHERELMKGPLTWPQWNMATTPPQEENEENG